MIIMKIMYVTTEVLDPGGLVVADDKLCQWTIFSFILFWKCEKQNLPNILITNYFSASSPLQRKKTRQEDIKLT